MHPRLGCGPPLGSRRRVLPSAAVLAKILHGAPAGGPRPPAGWARVPSAWPLPVGVLATGAAALPRPAAPPAPPRPGRPATLVPPPSGGERAATRRSGRRSGRGLEPQQAQAQRPLQPDRSHPWLPTAPPEPRPRKPQVRPQNTQAPPPGLRRAPGHRTLRPHPPLALPLGTLGPQPSPQRSHAQPKGAARPNLRGVTRSPPQAGVPLRCRSRLLARRSVGMGRVRQAQP